jgi:hypothetical protein
MSSEYCVYGLQVLADAPIPGLFPSNNTDRIDIRVRLNQRPSWWEERFTTDGTLWYQSEFIDHEGRPILNIWQLEREGWYRFAYPDGNEFVVNPQAGEIWSMWPPSILAEDSATYLVGPVLGFVLRMRGICCLHASAVSIGQKIIAFAGPPHAGKSTTAAAFATLGYSVVSDDIVAIVEKDQVFMVRPGYPRLCLWPDVTAGLFGSERLPRIIPNVDQWDKRYLDLTSDKHGFQVESLPLAAIYLLNGRSSDADCPKVEAITTHDALVKLAANTYMNYLLDRDLRSQEFQLLSRMVSGLPIRRVTPHTDQANLPKLCETILEDLAALAG